MIIVLLGTRAQLIKMAPVMRELQRRSVPYKLIYTGQHKETIAQLASDFAVPPPEEYVYGGGEVTGVIQMVRWFVYCLCKLLRGRGTFLPLHPSAADVIVVHGDTLSTLLGALIGRLTGMRVAHVEAGLRSHNLLQPFPEELTRLAVFRLSNIAFCPGEWAYRNMKRFRAERIDTGANTLLDSVRVVVDAAGHASRAGTGNYGVCSIHRFENIFSRRRLAAIVDLVEEMAKTCLIVFVLHPTTRIKLHQFGLLARLERNPEITLAARMGYVKFVQLLRDSRFVITDGGGNQEELSYLGIPTLLMRKTTERPEGLGRTAVVCDYDMQVVREFLARPRSSDAGCNNMNEWVKSPSELIVDRLASYA